MSSHRETHCRFCSQHIGDWRSGLVPRAARPATPTMAICCDGQVHKVKVRMAAAHQTCIAPQPRAVPVHSGLRVLCTFAGGCAHPQGTALQHAPALQLVHAACMLTLTAVHVVTQLPDAVRNAVAFPKYKQVSPGEAGKAAFQQQIRALLGLSDDDEFDVLFQCKAPDTGAHCMRSSSIGFIASLV